MASAARRSAKVGGGAHKLSAAAARPSRLYSQMQTTCAQNFPYSHVLGLF